MEKQKEDLENNLSHLDKRFENERYMNNGQLTANA